MFTVVARAHLQSITIDEATTYDMWIRPLAPDYWFAASNNHILNSVLIRIGVQLFGLSHLTMRCGAILGALLYSLAIRWYCLRTLDKGWLQVAAFVCFAGNPFVLDYLVAARGYGLALGFLAWLVVIAGWSAASAMRRCIWSSILAAFCIASNFSFGVVAAIAHAASIGWIVKANRGESILRLTVASVVPALLVTAFLTSNAILTWPPGQLGYGADSLLATFGSVIDSSLHQPSRYIVNPLLLPLFQWVAPFLFPFLVLTCVLCVVLNRSWEKPFVVYVALVLAGALMTHWLLFLKLQTKLPLERTALFIVLLVMVLVTSVAASVPTAPAGRILTRMLRVGIVLTAVYFVSCFRLSYFKEWEWNAEVRQAYLACRAYKGTVVSGWHYTASLNFYRWMHQEGGSVPEIRDGNPTPAGDVYVLHSLFDAETIEKRQLKVVFKGDFTDVVVAIPPEK